MIGNILQPNSNKINCTSTQYFNKETQKCMGLPNLCREFDYGVLTCTFCWLTNILIDGLCRNPSLRFCDRFQDGNPYLCDNCIAKFYTTDGGYCVPFPSFCEQVVSQKCVRCISQFLLNSKGFCEDPNCANASPYTFECQVCKFSYIKNDSTGICTFNDVNCIQTGPKNSCLKCTQNYLVDPIKGLCRFVDPNCKVFSSKEECVECNQGLYLNSLTNLCVQKPYNCLTVNSVGQCQLCGVGYALVTNYEC